MKGNIKDVAVVVVFYNPSEVQIQKFEELSKDVCIIGVDNSDISNNINLQNYFPQYCNLGIAKAQNIGIEIALKLFYNYIVVFDQDSYVSSSFIEEMKEEYLLIKKYDENIGILGPLIIEESTGREYKNLSNPKRRYSIVPDVISSGMFFSADVVKKAGLLEDDLFIDYVDCEWCWRARKKGIITYMTRAVILPHTVGEKYISLLGFCFGVSAAFRYYYQYRNVLWLIKRSYPPFIWKVKIILRLIANFFIIPIISKEHMIVMKNMIRGIHDGLSN